MNVQLDVPGLLSVLMDRAPAGFAIGLHVRYQTPAYLFQTYPAEWMEEYSRDGLVLRDPTIAWSLDHRGVTTWAALEDQDPAGVLGRARAHGLAYGIAVSLEEGGSRSMAGFARREGEFPPEDTEVIVGAMRELHRLTSSAIPLTPETREALRRLSVAFTQP